MIAVPFLIMFAALGFFGAPFFAWALAILLLEVITQMDALVIAITLATSLIFIIHPLRTLLISKPVLWLMKKLKLVPKITDTEKEAIAAGNAWVEKEFFNGNPSLKTLLSQPLPTLTADEQKFLDHQVEALCAMIDDWKIWQSRDIPKPVWEFILKERFLGLGIEKKYGGLGFSPYAHSEVIKKLASKSFVVAIYVMVPNSLGPAELIHRYGTSAQKNQYLPRLASGEEIPCFGLTEAWAGSDAGNVHASGVIFKQGDQLGIKLNWDKRYISLAKISTLVGLAFQLKDPDHLLGDREELGITCALIPANAPGVTIEHRHDPLGVPFYNCPLHGENVEIPLSSVVGGQAQIGQGWKMLMECLAAGRGISFPAQMAGSSQLTALTVFYYSQIREQFGVAIRQFEGVQKPLVEIFSFTYLIEALRTYTLSALHQDLKPAIIASISKYYSTEYSRKLINHAMDVLGGAGISMGPRNKIAPYYIAAPISITVEGANILTRSLMIFGQGAFRAHPHAFSMIDALEKENGKEFDKHFFNLVGHGVMNFFRSVLLSATRGWLAHPFSFRKQSVYYRKISWASASFAFYTDVAMGALGGKLKFLEATCGRFADILSYLYMAAAVLRKYESEGEKSESWPLVKVTLDHLFYETELAFQALYANLPGPLNYVLKPVHLWSRINPLSCDVSDPARTECLKNVYDLGNHEIENLSQRIYHSSNGNDQLPKLKSAFQERLKLNDLFKKQKTGLLTEAEAQSLQNWRKKQWDVIQVDEFSEAEYHRQNRPEMPEKPGT